MLIDLTEEPLYLFKIKEVNMYDSDSFIVKGEKMVIYNYSTKHLSQTDKVRFYYALKGRDGKSGIVKELKLLHLGKAVLITALRYAEEVEQFFKVWNISFSKRNAIISKEVFGGGHY